MLKFAINKHPRLFLCLKAGLILFLLSYAAASKNVVAITLIVFSALLLLHVFFFESLRESKRDFLRIVNSYAARKKLVQPDLRVWEFIAQMLASAYFSWRWIGGENGRFKPWSIGYWAWLADYSSPHELAARASLAADRIRHDCGGGDIDFT